MVDSEKNDLERVSVHLSRIGNAPPSTRDNKQEYGFLGGLNRKFCQLCKSNDVGAIYYGAGKLFDRDGKCVYPPPPEKLDLILGACGISSDRKQMYCWGCKRKF
ncbi:MAG: hypothetical protein WC588_00030 [Candidatus Micrarchaeia archaeon]